MTGAGGKLVLLFLIAALLLSFPALAIFNRPATLGGIPVLYLYLFAIWVIAIATVAVLARKPWGGES